MSKKYLIPIIILLIILIALVAGYVFGWFGNRYSSNLPESSESIDQIDLVSEQAQVEGNKIYKNFLLSYRIDYPESARVEDTSIEKADSLENSNCLKISADEYYVLIGKNQGVEASNDCFRNETSDGWSGIKESITAAGQDYPVEGKSLETGDSYQEYYSFTPVDERVKIEYGISVDNNPSSREQAKKLVRSIIESYSPAE